MKPYFKYKYLKKVYAPSEYVVYEKIKFFYYTRGYNAIKQSFQIYKNLYINRNKRQIPYRTRREFIELIIKNL